MPKIVYYTGTSLDGYIADPDESLDWLTSQPTPPGERFDAFLAGIGVLVMGRTTYEWVVRHEDLTKHPEKWSGYYGDRPTWLFTHHGPPRRTRCCHARGAGRCPRAPRRDGGCGR